MEASASDRLLDLLHPTARQGVRWPVRFPEWPGRAPLPRNARTKFFAASVLSLPG